MALLSFHLSSIILLFLFVVNIQANLRKRYVGKRREQRGNSTLEGAGTPRWVGIGFNPIPKPTPHHLSRSIPFKGEQIQLPFA